MSHRHNITTIDAKLEEKMQDVEAPHSRYYTKPMPFDVVFQYTILPFIPRFITPNAVTIFRYIAIPCVLYFLVIESLVIGLVLFVIAALSDAVDGALARTRRQITDWGILHDPLADKLLIGSVALLVITQYISPWLTAVIVGIEIILIVSAYFRYTGKVVPAKTVGKIKMVLQSVGVGVLLLGVAISAPLFITTAIYILYGAVGFGLLSLFVYRSI